MAQRAQLSRVGRMFKHNTAFFLCDMEEKFLSRLHFGLGILKTANVLVRASKVLGCPLIVTEQATSASGGTTARHVQLPDTAKLFQKSKFSMWIPAVEAELEKHPKVENVILFGLEAHVCVLMTAMDLIEKGFTVHIAADATTSIRTSERTIAFDRMRAMGAFISTADSLLYQLVQDAQDESFKDIADLVKEPRPDTGLATGGRL